MRVDVKLGNLLISFWQKLKFTCVMQKILEIKY